METDNRYFYDPNENSVYKDVLTVLEIISVSNLSVILKNRSGKYKSMNEEKQKLWNAIKSFELDQPEISLSFTDRLARENGWPIEYAIRAISEYKKFIFLLVIAPHPLTPSDEVDQVWHLHLLYTQSYWEDFCENTIKTKIHHGPTKGGFDEKTKFTNWYEKTKDLYFDIFETKPPKDIWPASDIRFSEINFRRVNLKKNWILKKPF